MMEPGELEYELGIPIPGVILPRDRWAKTAIKRLPETGPLDWQAIFGRQAPIVLDLGCGNGRFVLASALARPEYDHVGLDILPCVIRYATRRANQRGLSNVRFVVCGGEQFLAKYVAPGSVTEIHVYHPQPYDDPQKIDRRMVTPRFLTLVHRCLAPEGLFVIQTDNLPYWRYMAAIIPRFFEFQEQVGPWPDAPAGRTRREIVARARGLPIFRAWGRPRKELDAAALDALAAELQPPLFDARPRRTVGKRGPRRGGR